MSSPLGNTSQGFPSLTMSLQQHSAVLIFFQKCIKEHEVLRPIPRATACSFKANRAVLHESLEINCQIRAAHLPAEAFVLFTSSGLISLCPQGLYISLATEITVQVEKMITFPSVFLILSFYSLRIPLVNTMYADHDIHLQLLLMPPCSNFVSFFSLITHLCCPYTIHWYRRSHRPHP